MATIERSSTRRIWRRRRGTLDADRDRLKQKYDKSTRGKRRATDRVASSGDPLLDATGDPLVSTDRALAIELYGLHDAARPNTRLRRLRDEIFGGSLSSVTEMALWFQDHRAWPVYRSAAEAVALAAERGTWIGVNAPVSFDKAVDMVRAAVRNRRADRIKVYSPPAWTGRYFYVVPAPGSTLYGPGRPYVVLPATGAWVPDDAHWRRHVACGSALVQIQLQKKDQP